MLRRRLGLTRLAPACSGGRRRPVLVSGAGCRPRIDVLLISSTRARLALTWTTPPTACASTVFSMTMATSRTSTMRSCALRCWRSVASSAGVRRRHRRRPLFLLAMMLRPASRSSRYWSRRPCRRCRLLLPQCSVSALPCAQCAMSPPSTTTTCRITSTCRRFCGASRRLVRRRPSLPHSGQPDKKTYLTALEFRGVSGRCVCRRRSLVVTSGSRRSRCLRPVTCSA